MNIYDSSHACLTHGIEGIIYENRMVVNRTTCLCMALLKFLKYRVL